MDAKTKQLTFAASVIAVGFIAAAFIFTGGVKLPSAGGTASLVKSEPGLKEFNIVMENNRYNPSTITANLGDTVVINFTNRDTVSHGVGLAEFNATVPNGHVPAGGTARMEFLANKIARSDVATCGGPNPTDKSDDHGEELIVNVI